MKQDNNTTASIWWHNLPYSAKYDLSIQYFKMVPGTLNDEAIEEIHNGEHPEQPAKEQSPLEKYIEFENAMTEKLKEESSNREEGDILEAKIVSDALQQWDNVGYDKTDNPKDTYIAGAKFIGIPLAKENQALRESNTRLKERIEVLEGAFYMDICRAYNAGKQNALDMVAEGKRMGETVTSFISSHDYFKAEFPEFTVNVP